MTETLAEMKVLDIDGGIEGKAACHRAMRTVVGQRWDCSGITRAA